jgi:hypothetical protein
MHAGLQGFVVHDDSDASDASDDSDGSDDSDSEDEKAVGKESEKARSKAMANDVIETIDLESSGDEEEKEEDKPRSPKKLARIIDDKELNAQV